MEGLLNSAQTYFLVDCCSVHYFVFTDSSDDLDIDPRVQEVVTFVSIKHSSWPSATLRRFHVYLENANYWTGFDYVFAVDVDVRFMDFVGEEILGESTATLHADNGYYRGTEVTGVITTALANRSPEGVMWRQHAGVEPLLTRANYESRMESTARVATDAGSYYFAGGLYGGRTTAVRRILQKAVSGADQDAVR